MGPPALQGCLPPGELTPLRRMPPSLGDCKLNQPWCVLSCVIKPETTHVAGCVMPFYVLDTVCLHEVLFCSVKSRMPHTLSATMGASCSCPVAPSDTAIGTLLSLYCSVLQWLCLSPESHSVHTQELWVTVVDTHLRVQPMCTLEGFHT